METTISNLQKKDFFKLAGSNQILRVENRTEDTVHFWQGRTMRVVWFERAGQDLPVTKVN